MNDKVPPLVIQIDPVDVWVTIVRMLDFLSKL